MTFEASNLAAIPNSALLCEHLMDMYGEESHHGTAQRQARFEVKNNDGREFSMLLIQKGIGSAAVYEAYLHEILNGKYEIIYTMSIAGKVSEQMKTEGKLITEPLEWPANTGSHLFYEGFDNRTY